MNKALVIGIDDYQSSPLKACVNDAVQVAKLLERNQDGEKNLHVELLTSNKNDVSNFGIQQAVSRFFKSTTRADIAVFYFAGHGIFNELMDAGYIAGNDCRGGAWGVSLSELLGLANNAHKYIASSVIILDCCKSGHLGAEAGAFSGGASVVGKGLTILTSCDENEKAKEKGRHGVFTALLLDGLRGGCADIRGNITPAALYSHIDRALGPNDQRPLYKANVQNFVSVRQVAPKIPIDVLLALPTLFPNADEPLPLDPSYEPKRDNVPDHIKQIPVNPENAWVFERLQMCTAQALVEPVGEKHMYYAAINSKSCKLTALGKHYRRLAEQNNI